MVSSQPQTSALPIFIGGIAFQGLGWMFALLIFSIYLTRLINSEIPEEPKRPGMYIAVGPACKSSPRQSILHTANSTNSVHMQHTRGAGNIRA